MPVLVNDMLKGKGKMDGAKLWQTTCLGGGPQLLLLCVLDKAMYRDAGM